MKTSLECISCFLRQALEAARTVSPDNAAVQDQIVHDILLWAVDMDFGQPPPAMGQRMHRRLRQITDIIDNGSDTPGTIVEQCSPAFRQCLERADLVISKGQGNYETLSDFQGNVFFLFKAKCPVVAADIGLPVGTHVLARPRVRLS